MVFQCINIRQVPWEVLKTAAFGLGFQHLPRDLASVNAWKTLFDPYIQTQNYAIYSAYEWFFPYLADALANVFFRCLHMTTDIIRTMKKDVFRANTNSVAPDQPVKAVHFDK